MAGAGLSSVGCVPFLRRVREVETRPPLIPHPLTPRDALREAARQIALARLPEFDRDLGEASDQAIQLVSATPVRLFLEKWQHSSPSSASLGRPA